MLRDIQEALFHLSVLIKVVIQNRIVIKTINGYCNDFLNENMINPNIVKIPIDGR